MYDALLARKRKAFDAVETDLIQLSQTHKELAAVDQDSASLDAKQRLRACGVTDITGMVQVIEAGDLSRLPADAYSLQVWLDRARVALAAT